MKNFQLTEFACKHCGEVKMNAYFLDKLDNARDIAGVPFTINSGYRCPAHNKAIGSTSQNHPQGRAADIKAEDRAIRMKILTGLILAGFRRIGVHPKFIHVDSMDYAGSPESCWFY